MSRVLALAVAVGLIIGATVVRNVVVDDGDDRGSAAGSRGVVVCATELRVACDAIDGEVRVEDAMVTAASLSKGIEDVGVWVTPAPWLGIVDETREFAGADALFGDAPAPVARSPLVVVGPASLDGCDWRCLGDRAGADLDLGGRPLSSTIGTLHLGALATGWFGTNEFAANAFDGAFSSWIRAVVDATSATSEPVTRLLQSRAFFDAALSHEAEAEPSFTAASEDRRAGLVLLYPQPVAYLDVVVAGVGSDPGDATDAARAALADAGWQPATADGDGLPRPGVLVALRELV